ncbi:MAG TPA: helix-turn-helix transcriptional regulator [Candidatus Obscuribacterales bacterium]
MDSLPAGNHSFSVKNRKTLLKKFGQAVRRLRRSLGLSQEEFAMVAGLDRSYVGAIERGEQNPSLWTIARLANALDVTVSELVGDLNSR